MAIKFCWTELKSETSMEHRLEVRFTFELLHVSVAFTVTDVFCRHGTAEYLQALLEHGISELKLSENLLKPRQSLSVR